MFQWRVVWHSHCGNIVPKTLVPVSGPWRRARTICDEKEEKWFISLRVGYSGIMWGDWLPFTMLVYFVSLVYPQKYLWWDQRGTALLDWCRLENQQMLDDEIKGKRTRTRVRFNLISEYPVGNFINGYEALARLVLRVIHIQDWVDENAKQKTP